MVTGVAPAPPEEKDVAAARGSVDENSRIIRDGNSSRSISASLKGSSDAM